ncbi:MAG: GIY-YIG nuclease family protein, partial [Nitrospirales bacterium]|nr:GIY-YIG nuclease family protein [Nitrospirales bacterium]
MPKPDRQQWCVYALVCRNGAIYIGSTNNLARRLSTHASGKGSKFVWAFRPFQLAKVIICHNGTEARRLEYQLKKLRRPQKLKALTITPDQGSLPP